MVIVYFKIRFSESYILKINFIVYIWHWMFHFNLFNNTFMFYLYPHNNNYYCRKLIPQRFLSSMFFLFGKNTLWYFFKSKFKVTEKIDFIYQVEIFIIYWKKKFPYVHLHHISFLKVTQNFMLKKIYDNKSSDIL